MEQLIAIAIERLQSGVLRKVKQPSLAWQGRLSSGGPWKPMLAAIRSATTRNSSSSGTLDPDSYEAFEQKWMTGMNDLLDQRSPCEIAAMSNEEISSAIEKTLPLGMSDETREDGSIRAGILTPNLLNAARRAGRTEIDRELTLRVLQVRFEKGTPGGPWPGKLLDPTSAVCPEAGYAYRADRSGIEIRFEGTTMQPTYAVPVVPLLFRSRQPPPPTLTPTPTTDRTSKP